MNLLFIGDVVGESGCSFLAANLSRIKRENGIDVTVVNGENSANGNGITARSADSILSAGADVITTGNHCFKRREGMEVYERSNIIRPANFPEGAPGRGYCILDMGAWRMAVINLLGTLYLEALDNPFSIVQQILSEIDTPNILVDFHAETTSEKKAMGFFLSKKVTAVLGTHTHVQTADEAILDGHTAYLTDVGMTGPEDSVIGVSKDIAVAKQVYHMPVKFTEADTKPFLNGVVVTFNEKTGKSTNIKRLIIR